MKIKTKLMRRLVAAIFFVAGATGAQVPTGTQSNAPSNTSPDCADLPVLNERLERANKILHDWPNLGRYAEANATLAAPPNSGLIQASVIESPMKTTRNSNFAGAANVALASA